MILEWHEGESVVTVCTAPPYILELPQRILVRISPQEMAMLERIAGEARAG